MRTTSSLCVFISFAALATTCAFAAAPTTSAQQVQVRVHSVDGGNHRRLAAGELAYESNTLEVELATPAGTTTRILLERDASLFSHDYKEFVTDGADPITKESTPVNTQVIYRGVNNLASFVLSASTGRILSGLFGAAGEGLKIYEPHATDNELAYVSDYEGPDHETNCGVKVKEQLRHINKVVGSSRQQQYTQSYAHRYAYTSSHTHLPLSPPPPLLFLRTTTTATTTSRWTRAPSTTSRSTAMRVVSPPALRW